MKPSTAARRWIGCAITVPFALVVACGWTGTSAAAAGREVAGGVSLQPGHVDPSDPATRAYFKPVLGPGATYRDDVLVGNASSKPVTLLVSPVDGLTATTSGAVYGNRQDPLHGAGAWVTPSTSTLTLAPASQVQVPFEVHVPSDATPGDHLAGLAFENAHPTTSGGDVAITEIIRSVIGIQIRVPGPASVSWLLGRAHVQSAPGIGTASVVVPLTNTGQLLAKPRLTVSLSGPGGYHRTVSRTLDTVLPADPIQFPLPWPDSLVSGTYEIRTSLGPPGEVATLTTQDTLGQAIQGGSLTAAKPSRPVGANWWPLVALVALPAAILIGVIIGRRSKRPLGEDPKPDVEDRGRADGLPAWLSSDPSPP